MDLARVRRPVRIVKLHVQPIPFCFASIRAAATARSIDGIWPSIGRLTRAKMNIRTTLAEDQLAIEAVLDAERSVERSEGKEVVSKRRTRWMWDTKKTIISRKA